ncbi:MAG TPA: hypothetical protein VFC07_05600 [Verrucomicrobiae bacterium]|nr:hypothetical protein [Verrucomicrobiae bacterium]
MAFIALLAMTFLQTRDLVFILAGCFPVVLVASGVYSFLRSEEWHIKIHNGILTWSYARWPKSAGSIDLRTVCGIVVSDCSSTLSFSFQDGTSRKIKFIGSGARIRDCLKENFPSIALEFIEGT